MYDDYDSDGKTGQLKGHKAPVSGAETQPFTERRTMNRWQFRADQVQMLQQQVQTELIISMLVAAIVATVFWSSVPHELLLTWSVAVDNRRNYFGAMLGLARCDRCHLW
jgi:hypothetical protein